VQADARGDLIGGSAHRIERGFRWRSAQVTIGGGAGSAESGTSRLDPRCDPVPFAA